MSLGVLEAPGAYGCAIAIGEGQSAGNWPSYGGPHYGFLAARGDFVRRMPGRIVGETVDADGRRAFVLTLQTREQHIRREKATSNITTNQTLLALAGPRDALVARPGGAARGGGDVPRARRSTRASGSPLEPAFEAAVVQGGRVPDADARRARSSARARERGVHPGYALGRDYEGMDDVLLVALTEKRTVEDIDRLADGARGGVRMSAEPGRPGATRRSSSSARVRDAARAGRRVPTSRCRSCRRRFAARGRRGCPSLASRRSSATSRRSPTAPSASTPASTRSAPAR